MPSGVFDLEARPVPSVPSADGARAPRSRREEKVDARASSTTSNAEIGHDPHRPKGLRRHGPAFFVAAPRRWKDIAVVAAPRIRVHGARNGRRWGPRPGLEGARSAYLRYVTARLRRLCLTATSACPMGLPGGEPSATLRCCRRGEHPEARKLCWVRFFGGRSRKLVRYAG